MRLSNVVANVFLISLISVDTWAQTTLTNRDFYNKSSKSIVYIEIEGATATGEPQNSIGSGFIISESGYILTSYHLFADQKKKPFDTFIVKGVIGTINGYKLDIERISVDPDHDLALLKFVGGSKDYSPIKLCNSEVYPSQSVGALGFGLGFELQLVLGSISSAGGLHGRWQINLSVSQGFSGGPVFDQNGQVIAVTTEGVPGVAGANFATPISFASNMAETVPGGVSLACDADENPYVPPMSGNDTPESNNDFQILDATWAPIIPNIPQIENVGCSCVQGIFPPRDPMLTPKPPGTMATVMNYCQSPVGVVLQQELGLPPYAPQFMPAPGRQFVSESLQSGQTLRVDVSHSRIGAIWITDCPNQSKIYPPIPIRQ